MAYKRISCNTHHLENHFTVRIQWQDSEVKKIVVVPMSLTGVKVGHRKQGRGSTYLPSNSPHTSVQKLQHFVKSIGHHQRLKTHQSDKSQYFTNRHSSGQIIVMSVKNTCSKIIGNELCLERLLSIGTAVVLNCFAHISFVHFQASESRSNHGQYKLFYATRALANWV